MCVRVGRCFRVGRCMRAATPTCVRVGRCMPLYSHAHARTRSQVGSVEPSFVEPAQTMWLNAAMMLALNLVMLPFELLLIAPFTTLGAKIMNASQPGWPRGTLPPRWQQPGSCRGAGTAQICSPASCARALSFSHTQTRTRAHARTHTHTPSHALSLSRSLSASFSHEPSL